MIYDEHLYGKQAEDFLSNNQDKLETVISVTKNTKNDDMVIMLAEKINMVDIFQGMGKLFCILEKLTGKNIDILIGILKESIRLEKEFDKKHKAEKRIVDDAYKNN